jgi:hypothetical protein
MENIKQEMLERAEKETAKAVLPLTLLTCFR